MDVAQKIYYYRSLSSHHEKMWVAYTKATKKCLTVAGGDGKMEVWYNNEH